MSLKFKCPKCRQVLSAGDSAAGKVARCKHCQAKFRVPTPKASLVAKPDPIPQAARPVPPHATGPTKTGPAKTAPTTTTPPLAKRATPSAPDLPPASPASTDPASTNPDDPFGDLPDFQSFEQPIAKPVTAVDPLHQAMSANSEIPNTVSPAPTPSQSSADTKAPTASSASIHDNLADALSGIDDTVSAAVAAQQQRNAAAIAPKVSVAEIQAAFRGEMADFDRDVKVKGRLALVAFAMIVLPIMFSIFVIVASIMAAVVARWRRLRWISVLHAHDLPPDRRVLDCRLDPRLEFHVGFPVAVVFQEC